MFWINSSWVYSLRVVTEIKYFIALCSSGEVFWVGKASLRSWRQLALEQLEEDEQETKHSNSQTNGQGPHSNNSKG